METLGKTISGSCSACSIVTEDLPQRHQRHLIQPEKPLLRMFELVPRVLAHEPNCFGKHIVSSGHALRLVVEHHAPTAVA